MGLELCPDLFSRPTRITFQPTTTSMSDTRISVMSDIFLMLSFIYNTGTFFFSAHINITSWEEVVPRRSTRPSTCLPLTKVYLKRLQQTSPNLWLPRQTSKTWKLL